MLDASKKIKNIYNKSCLFGICNIKNKEEDIFVWDNRVSVSMIHSIAIASLLKIPKKEKLKIIIKTLSNSSKYDDNFKHIDEEKLSKIVIRDYQGIFISDDNEKLS